MGLVHFLPVCQVNPVSWNCIGSGTFSSYVSVNPVSCSVSWNWIGSGTFSSYVSVNPVSCSVPSSPSSIPRKFLALMERYHFRVIGTDIPCSYFKDHVCRLLTLQISLPLPWGRRKGTHR